MQPTSNLQVQAQLFCTDVHYCDFIVYTKEGLHIERIKPDPYFMEEKLTKAKQFFEIAILPELLGRWFSRPCEEGCTAVTVASQQSHSSDAAQSATSDERYCYCQRGEEGKMVGCDNLNCAYKWFHLECLGLKALPRSSKWYCPDCRKLRKK